MHDNSLKVPRSRQIKRALVMGATALVLMLGVGIACAFWPFVVIKRLDSRYGQTQKGMTMAEVENLMGSSGLRLQQPSQFPAWDWERLPPDETARIKSVLRYRVDTFFLPVSFEFTFDDQQKLVGRHRYD